MNTVATLRANISALSPKDQEFAVSLLSAALGRGLSPKQAHWVGVLAERATAPQTPALGENEARVNEAREPGSLSRVVAMFDATTKAIVVIYPGAEDDVRVSPCGPSSKYAGSFAVTGTRANAEGRRAWLGQIDKAGVFHPSPRLTPNAVQGVSRALVAFARAPEEVARLYGQKHGRCCFCQIRLTDDRSRAVGYGETCATNRGLPWGAPKQPGVMDGGIICEGI